MKRLLSIALQKIRYQKATKILLVIYFLLLIATPLVFGTVGINIGGNKVYIRDLGMLDFPFVWHFDTYASSWYKVLFLIVVVSIVTMEYSNNTLKQNLIDGLSKKEFIASKCYMVLFFVGLSTVFVAITSLGLGLSFSNYTEMTILLKDMDYLVAFFVELMGFFSFGLFLSVLIKRSGLVIGTVLVWSIAENVTTVVLSKIYFVKTIYLSYLFPLKAMALIEQPILRTSLARQALKSAGQQIEEHKGVSWLAILVAVLWSLIFIWGSYRILKKRDL